MATQLRAADAVHIYAEELGSQSKIIDVYVFDTSGARLTHAAVLEWLSARIAIVPIFRQRLRRLPGDLDYPYWDFDPFFDLAAHVSLSRFAGVGWDMLSELLGEIVDGPVSLNRPPWELHVITGVARVDGIPDGAAVAVLKFHHCVGDATATVGLARALFAGESADDEGAADATAVASRTRMLGSAVRRSPANAVRLASGLTQLRKDTRTIAEAADRGEVVPPQRTWPVTRFNRMLTSSTAIELVRFDLAAVDEIRAAVPGATVNDVALSVIGGALRAYLGETGELPDTSLGARVPRSVRSLQSSDAGNQFVVLSVNLHTDVADPLQRLREVFLSAQAEKRRLEHPAVLRTESVLGEVPAPYLKAAMKADARAVVARADAEVPGGNTLVSNVARGAGKDLHFCSAPAVDAFGVLPVADGAGVSHFVASMANRVTITVTADRELLPDLDRYVGILRDSFDELARGCGVDRQISVETA
ncbi:wax ester/triacylglycerol synthase domain-containing protein [Speluncibacter jeojiensis]|uniref:diacylglycerol O-acyltransferase n=1 Tax=Speluncibacter jeojiensis TaxID=2710754 RepID=A0A9X4M1N3_9ACTN|nr:WS/DGAT domain-containing protein [Corynebacteriales bacterium D3-21]